MSEINEYQRTFSFGDVDLTPRVFVTGTTRSILPPVRLDESTISGLDGSLVKHNGFESCELTVSGFLFGDALDDTACLRRLLAKMLSFTSPQALKLPDEPWNYYLAWFKGAAETSRQGKFPSVELTFLCPDPVAFGQSRTQTVTTTQTVVNTGGTCKSYPIVTAKPPSGSSWRITNVSTGDFVLVYATFTGSQTLVLDMEKQRCTINGSDKAVDISSDFFAIEGTQKLQVSGGSATLAWNERWL